MKAGTRIASRTVWSLLLAGGLALCPLAIAAPVSTEWSYLGYLKKAEAGVGAPGVFARIDAMNPQQRAAFLEEQRGAINLLQDARSISGDAAGAVQAAVWFDIANGHPERYAAQSGKPLEGARAEDALQAIVREARNRQIVILNEAHHVPVNRVFARKLARELRKIGFAYLAGETFEEDIPPGSAAVMKTMGAYSKEPMYAGFLRTAMRDGWTFVTYDGSVEGVPDADRERVREIGSARNIVDKVFAKDPKAKLFMYVGYGHARKQQTANADGWKSVATLLRETLGVEPLTIDQSIMYGRGDVRTDHPQYRVAMQRFAPSKPIVLKAAEGGYAVIGAKPGSYDMQVYHPDETALTKEGRPLWMERQAGLAPHPVPARLLPSNGRRLIQAFHAADGEGAVPADMVLVEAGKPAPALMLPPGQFRFSYEE